MLKRSLLLLFMMLFLLKSVFSDVTDTVTVFHNGQGKVFEPGKINHLVFNVTNHSAATKSIRSDVILPAGLKLFFPATPFLLEPGKSKPERISFHLPESFPAGSHQLEVSFTDTETKKIISREKIDFEVPVMENIRFELLEMPSFVLDGQQFKASFLLKNLGNSRQKVRIETFNCDKVTPAFVDLEAGEHSVVEVSATTPESYRSAGTYNFSVRAHLSDQMKKENFLSVNVFPRKEEKVDPWFRFPVNLSARYIARGREGTYQQVYQLEASGKGYLDTENSHYLEFMARGPNSFDLSFLGYYDEYYIGYKNKNFESFIGSKSYQLTPLLEMSRYGYGTENRYISAKGDRVGFFYVKPRFFSDIKSETGAYANLNLYRENVIGLNFLRKSLTVGGNSALLGSVEGTFRPFSTTTLEMEYSAGGHSGRMDDAFRIRLDSRHKVISLSGNYYNAGKYFAGYYSNAAFYDANLHVNVSSSLSLSLSAREDFTQAALDTLLNAAPYSKLIMAALNYRLTSDLSLRLFYLDNLRKDRMQVKKFDYHSQTANLWIDRMVQKISWQLGGEYGKTENYLSLAGAKSRLDSYRGFLRIGYSPVTHFKLQAFTSYTNMNSFISPDQKNWMWGASAYGQLSRKLTVNFQVQNSYAIEDYYQNRNLFQLSADYQFIKRHKLSLASFYTLFQSQIEKPDYSVALTWSVNIGVPVRKTTELGSLVGIMENPKEKSGRRIILYLNGQKSITAEDGSFLFRNLVPGKYQLTLDRSNLDLDEVLNVPVPFLAEIFGERETTLHLSVVKAARVAGKIKGAQVSETVNALVQAPPQTGNIVLEMKDAFETVRIITQPDGSFEFPPLRPSNWTMKVYKNNIDPAYNLAQDNFDLRLQAGERREVMIELQPRTKSIIFKSTPVIVTTAVVKKDTSSSTFLKAGVTANSQEEIWFTVQVASSNLPAEEGKQHMPGVGEVTVMKIEGLYKYFSGKFSDYRAARAYGRKMAAIVPGAFLTSFRGETPVALKEAIDFWKLNRK